MPNDLLFALLANLAFFAAILLPDCRWTDRFRPSRRARRARRRPAPPRRAP